MRTKAIVVHITQALAEGALIAVLVVGLIAGTAFAAKGGNTAPGHGHGGSGTPSAGVCSVTPNPVALGGMYTVNGTGFNPYEMVQVQVSDSHGTQVLFPPIDGTGTFTATSYSSWAGTSTATVYDSGKTLLKVTSCSFQVG